MLVGRGGSRGAKIVNKYFVNKLAFPILGHVLKFADRRFEVIGANRSNAVKKGGYFCSANRFARIAPIRLANRRTVSESDGNL